MVKEIYCNDVKFSLYSRWHRHQTHNSVAMMDLDKVACCHACNEPLFLAETVLDIGQELKKGHSMTRQLAIKAKIPAFILWYKTAEDKLINIKVKKIAPDYKHGYSSTPIDYPPNRWLRFLEYKQVQHFPNCPKKDLFIKKVKEDPIASKSDIYAPILSI